MCGMPNVGPDVLAIMSLHARCKNSQALPFSGGVLDQPAYLMNLFDVIDQAHAEHQYKLQTREQDDLLKEKLAGKIAHG